MLPSVGELLDAAVVELREVRQVRLGALPQPDLDGVTPAIGRVLAQMERLSRLGTETRWSGAGDDRGWREASDSLSRLLAEARRNLPPDNATPPAPSELSRTLDRGADLYAAAADVMAVATRARGGAIATAPTERSRREVAATLAPHLRPIAFVLAEWASVNRDARRDHTDRRADAVLQAANALIEAADTIAITEAAWGTPAPSRDVPVLRFRDNVLANDQRTPALHRAMRAAEGLLLRADPPPTERWALDAHTPTVLAGQAVAFSITMDVTARLLEALGPAATDGPDDPREVRLGRAASEARTAQKAWADTRLAWAGVRSPWEAPAYAAVRHQATKVAEELGRAAFADPDWRLPPGPADRLRDVMEFRDDPEALAGLLYGLHSLSVSIATLASAHRSITVKLNQAGHLMVPTRTISERRDEPRPYVPADRGLCRSLTSAYDEAGRATCRAAKSLTPLPDLLVPGGTRARWLAPARAKDLALDDLRRRYDAGRDDPVIARDIA